jgi:hypothetical protein
MPCVIPQYKNTNTDNATCSATTQPGGPNS